MERAPPQANLDCLSRQTGQIRPRQSGLGGAGLVTALLLVVWAAGCARTDRTSAGPAPAARTPAVPAVVGRPQSAAERLLAARGLRWRFRGDVVVRARPLAPKGVAISPDPRIVAQFPPPGARLARQAPVVLETTCTRAVRAGRPPCR